MHSRRDQYQYLRKESIDRKSGISAGEQEWKRTKPGYGEETAVLGGYLKTRTVAHQPRGRRKARIRVVGGPARGRVFGDRIREGIIGYCGGSVIDPKLKGNGHTCVAQEKSLEGGTLRAFSVSSAGLYIFQ